MSFSAITVIAANASRPNWPMAVVISHSPVPVSMSVAVVTAEEKAELSPAVSGSSRPVAEPKTAKVVQKQTVAIARDTTPPRGTV